MFQIKIAELIVEIDNRYSEVEKLCKEYLVNEKSSDLHVSVSDADISKEDKQSETHYSKGYLESVCVYRKICEQLPKFDAFLLHASVISVDGSGYAFLGKSGIGKTTQTKLWLECFGDRAYVVNGDKPIIRYIKEKDCFYAYGTPWCGKERMQRNTYVPLRVFCFLEQGTQNQIQPLSQEEMTDRFFRQCLMPDMPYILQKFLDICDKVVQNIPAFLLTCRPEKEAVLLAWDAIHK